MPSTLMITRPVALTIRHIYVLPPTHIITISYMKSPAPVVVVTNCSADILV